MKDNEIIKALECCSGDGGKYDCHRCPNFKDYIDCKEDLSACALDLINCQKAKIAVLSVENANSKICVGDLNAELENKNVELAGMRGACESYKMHYDNAQAEVERLQTKNKKYKAILEAINDEINPLPFETDFDKAINKAKSEAIEGFAERFNSMLAEFDNYDTLHIYEIKDRLDILKEIVGDAK